MSACSDRNGSGSPEDRESFDKTKALILEGFAKGDVKAVLALHHPDVVKYFGGKNIVTGTEGLRKQLTDMFSMRKRSSSKIILKVPCLTVMLWWRRVFSPCVSFRKMVIQPGCSAGVRWWYMCDIRIVRRDGRVSRDDAAGLRVWEYGSMGV